MKLTLVEVSFEYKYSEESFFVKWERSGKLGYVANLFNGYNYVISISTNVAPNQTNSESILKRYLPEILLKSKTI